MGLSHAKGGKVTCRKRTTSSKITCNSMSSITASFPKAGAKVQLIQITASLQTVFFDTFLNFFRNLLIYNYVL